MPLAPKLNKFSTASPVIATFDYTDIIDGLGYIIFDCFATTNDTTISYGITSNDNYSDPISTSLGGYTNGSFAQKLDLTFTSSPFNTPRTAKGKCIINIPILASVASSNNTSQSYGLVRLYHWDGSTETLLGAEQQTSTVTRTTIGTTSKMTAIEIEITDKLFKVGDMLRVDIEMWGARTSGASGTSGCGLFHDPGNTSTTTGTPSTKLEMHVPFKIDL